MKQLRSLKGIFILIIFIVGTYFIYTHFKPSREIRDKDLNITSISDQFDALDNKMWYVGEWLTHNPASNRVDLNEGIISLPVKENDKGPYLLSKPIPIEDYDIIKIKRRVKVHYGSDYFAAGLAVFQTDKENLRPVAKEKRPFGDAVVLVEYAHDLGVDTKRPGIDNIRLLGSNWEKESNYALIDPIFDEWFTEELIIDNYSGTIKYLIKGSEYKVESIPFTKPYFRIFMHSYGAFKGHNVAIDYIDITLTYSENEALKDESE